MMREPATGELIWLTTIRKWQDVPGFDNAIDQTFDAGVKAWAKLTPVAGSTYYGSKQTGDDVTHRFEIRYLDGITAEHVVELNNIRYRVKRMSHMNGARRFTALEVKELGTIA